MPDEPLAINFVAFPLPSISLLNSVKVTLYFHYDTSFAPFMTYFHSSATVLVIGPMAELIAALQLYPIEVCLLRKTWFIPLSFAPQVVLVQLCYTCPSFVSILWNTPSKASVLAHGVYKIRDSNVDLYALSL